MPWSNNKFNSGASDGPKGVARKAKTVLSKELADQSVLEFVPMRFDLGTPEQAMNYLDQKNNGSDFRMNDAVRVQTGVDQVGKVNEEAKIEAAALEKLKDVEEQAYQQAYQLGLEEGHKAAFAKASREITERLETFDQLILTIKNLKKDLSTFNESHLVQLAFQMAARLAKVELEGNNEAMVQILRDAVNLSQDEEQITVQVSTAQYEFLEQLKTETGREFEFLKKIRFEANSDVRDGGCVVETNYGEVDARIEQRIEQLWSNISEHLPKVKGRIAS